MGAGTLRAPTEKRPPELLSWTRLALEVLIVIVGWTAAIFVFGIIGPSRLIAALDNSVGLALIVYVLIFAAAGFTVDLAFLTVRARASPRSSE